MKFIKYIVRELLDYIALGFILIIIGSIAIIFVVLIILFLSGIINLFII